MTRRGIQRDNQRGSLWSLTRRQYGVVARRQLLELGLSRHAIDHRLAKGRLHPVMPGIYAVGRPELSQPGRWTAAVLFCGQDAVLSHESAAAAWRIGAEPPDQIAISVPAHRAPRLPGIRVHRRVGLRDRDLTRVRAIPVTGPQLTLIDLALRHPPGEVEAAVNEADKLGLIDPERLRRELDDMPRRPGIGILRRMLDRHTFVLTDSELERRFLPIARAAGLPPPLTGQRLNGFKVDFWWPGLGLVVETDGLRYHRTPAQQMRDRRRDQAHAAAGLTPLRFTYAQVRFEPAHVRDTLSAIARRLSSNR
jgi:Protein of unknown function (DUF559)